MFKNLATVFFFFSTLLLAIILVSGHFAENKKLSAVQMKLDTALLENESLKSSLEAEKAQRAELEESKKELALLVERVKAEQARVSVAQKKLTETQAVSVAMASQISQLKNELVRCQELVKQASLAPSRQEVDKLSNENAELRKSVEALQDQLKEGGSDASSAPALAALKRENENMRKQLTVIFANTGKLIDELDAAKKALKESEATGADADLKQQLDKALADIRLKDHQIAELKDKLAGR